MTREQCEDRQADENLRRELDFAQGVVRLEAPPRSIKEHTFAPGKQQPRPWGKQHRNQINRSKRK